MVGVSDGRLYLSYNGGGSWTETQPAGSGNQTWATVASNADGTRLLAGDYPGRLYLYAKDWAFGLVGAPCATGCQADYKTVVYTQLQAYNGAFLKLNSDGFYSYDLGFPPTIFQRKITTTLEGDALKVDVLVLWTNNEQSFGLTQTEYLYGWK